MGKVSRDEEPDRELKKGGSHPSWNNLLMLLTARSLQHLAQVLDILGVGKAGDLNYISVEDLMEEGVTNSDALRLLQGFETFGAV